MKKLKNNDIRNIVEFGCENDDGFIRVSCDFDNALSSKNMKWCLRESLDTSNITTSKSVCAWPAEKTNMDI